MIFWKKIKEIRITTPTISFKINLVKFLNKFFRLKESYESLCKEHKGNLKETGDKFK